MAATVDAARRLELEALAYWQADILYLRERYGAEEPEIITARQNIADSFRRLDALRVPLWLQNAALAFGRDWRRTRQTGLVQWIKTRPGYTVREGATE